MPKIFLIFHGRFPSEKAASLFAARSAEAFVRQNYHVTLIVPKRAGVIEDPFEFYKMERTFDIQYVPTLDIFNWPVFRKLAFWASFISFSYNAFAYLLRTANTEDIIYSNESVPLWFASRRFKHAVYEMHDFPESKYWLFKKFLKRMRYVVTHNQWKAEKLVSKFKISPQKICVETNAVDIKAFDIPLSKEDARRQLGLPPHTSIIGYTGHLYQWKGVDTVAKAAHLLPECLFVIVGGTQEDVLSYRTAYPAKNIQWVGFRPHHEIPVWQRACDILVLPNTATERISAYYTSPMKLFEYMASGTPIVASRIPSIEEVVTDRTVAFAEADNPNSLADVLSNTLTHTEAARARAEEARAIVADHTWDARATRILSFITR